MTADVPRTEAANGCSHQIQFHSAIKQIVCHPILQVTLLGLIMCLLTIGLTRADYQAGVDAYEREDYDTALQNLRPLAEEGNPKAQFHLGQMYAKGSGVPQSNEEAATLYKKAAEGGDTIAQFVLGIWYEEGRGVSKDKAEAVKWYYKAAQQGSDLARYKLRRLFPLSTDILQNNEEKTDLYRKAAEHGYPKAQFPLGMMYQYGWGTPQDDKEAVKWYHRGCRKRRSVCPVRA